MKKRARTILELLIIIVIGVWVALLLQWQTRHPGEQLGWGAKRDQ